MGMSPRQVLISLMLLVGLPAIILAPPVSLVIIAEWLNVWFLTLVTIICMGLWAICAITLAAGLWGAIKETAIFGGGDTWGFEADRDDAPGLWRMVEEAASGTGVGQVSRIRITDLAEVSMARRSGKLRLDVGLPLLAAMTPSQLHALLVDVGQRTRAETSVTRFLRSAGSGLDRMATHAILFWRQLFRCWQVLYERTCPPAAQTDTGRSQQGIGEIGEAWERLRTHYVRRNFRQAGMRAPVGEGLNAVMGMKPQLPMRTGPGRPGVGENCYELLADPGRVEGLVMGNFELPLKSWSETIAVAVANQRRRRMEHACDELVGEECIEDATPRGILQGQESLYGLQEIEGEGGPDYAEVAVWIDPELLSILIEEVLIACGRLQVIHDWSSDPILMGPDGRPFDASILVGDGTAARIESLIPLLESWGADLDRPYGRPDAGYGDDDVVAAIALTRLGYNVTMPSDVWFTPTGVLIVASWEPDMPMRLRHRGDSQSRICQMRDEIGIDRLRARPGSIWIALARLEEINLCDLDLRIRVRGRRREIALHHYEATCEVGSLWNAAMDLYPGRLTTGRSRVPAPGAPGPIHGFLTR